MTCPECGGDMITCRDPLTYNPGEGCRYRVCVDGCQGLETYRCEECSHEVVPENTQSVINSIKHAVAQQFEDGMWVYQLSQEGYIALPYRVRGITVWVYDDHNL